VRRGTLRVVLDANVLFPFTLRDTLLRAAAADVFQVCWSATILDEMSRNLVRTGLATDAQAERLVSAMQAAFPEASVHDFESLVGGLHNDPKDRHVVAAAVRAGATAVVTWNLKDFHPLPPGLVAIDPDTFLCERLTSREQIFAAVLRAQAGALRKPPRSVADILGALERMVPRFATRLRTCVEGLP